MTSKRIEIISSLVKPNAKVLDIGTDHCFVPIFLYQNNITKSIDALDVNPNPLAIAKQNLIDVNLESKIKLILNDGLENLDSNIYNVIIIAGLGGATISQIIDGKNFKGELILHPTNNQMNLRQTLMENNFKIINEMIVNEKNIENLIIKAIYTTNKIKLTKFELQIGPKLIINNSPNVTKYYEKKAFFYQELYVKSNKNEHLMKEKEYREALNWRKNNLNV